MLRHRARVTAVEALLEPGEELQAAAGAHTPMRLATFLPRVALWACVQTALGYWDLDPIHPAWQYLLKVTLSLTAVVVLLFPQVNPVTWAIAMTDRDLLLVRLGRVGRRDVALHARLPRATPITCTGRRSVVLAGERLALDGPERERQRLLDLAEQACRRAV